MHSAVVGYPLLRVLNPMLGVTPPWRACLRLVVAANPSMDVSIQLWPTKQGHPCD